MTQARKRELRILAWSLLAMIGSFYGYLKPAPIERIVQQRVIEEVETERRIYVYSSALPVRPRPLSSTYF